MLRITRPSHRRELRQALALLLDPSPETLPRPEDHLDVLMHHLQSRGLSLDHCLLSYRGPRLTGACLAIDQAGRTSSLFLPARPLTDEQKEDAVELLRTSTDAARRRGMRLLQVLVDEGTREIPEVLQRARFEFLTTLDYLERDVALHWRDGRAFAPVSWMTYAESRHDLFADVIRSTYESSLDCVALNRRRDIQDVLASHRATGQFHPGHWMIARGEAGEAIGVLLLAYVPERWSCDVVYLGLMPPYRGLGFGATLVRKAVQVAREMAASTLSLTVDASNVPAQKLYAAAGFRKTAAREAWVRFTEDAEG